MIHQKYNILEQIGAGTFGTIHKALNIRTNELVAIKIEPISSKLKLLVHETKMYNYLHDCKGIPVIKWFGKDALNYYMVINFLGPSLQDSLRHHTRFSLETTLQIGFKVILLLQTIHEKGIVHRDIKPDNFLFGRNPDESINDTLYLIDFGLCKSYLDKHHKHIPLKPISNIIGSKNFCSISCHRREELGRKDDLESFAYMLLYLHTGQLPWMHDTLESAIVTKKEQASLHCPSPISDIITIVQQMDFYQAPNYDYLIQQLSSELPNNNI